MRFSGSVYDNLRQPGVFRQMERAVGSDRTRMKETVLARLRLDDLLANDSVASYNARVVASFTDVLDGRLFTLFDPDDLKGIDLEIVCPKSIADDPTSAVARTLRTWIHDNEGHGRQVFFMAAPSGFTRTDLASAFSEMKNLDVRTVKDALEVTKSAGFSNEHVEALEGHWRKWDEAVQRRHFALTAFPGKPASAAPVLSRFFQRWEKNMCMPDFALTEVGIQVFRDALQILKESKGRRDATVKFLEDRQSQGRGTDRNEIRMVKAIFFHHMFAVIAQGNNAVAEHSDGTGEDDSYALPTIYFDKVESFEEDTKRIDLDPRIVSGLGEVDGSDYERVKTKTVRDIRAGIERFKDTVNEPKEKGDVSKLNDAFEKLTREVSTSVEVPSKGAMRKIFWSVAGAGGGALVGAALAGAALEIMVAGASIGPGIVTAADQTAAKMTTNFSRILFKKSLVRTSTRELSPHDPESK